MKAITISLNGFQANILATILDSTICKVRKDFNTIEPTLVQQILIIKIYHKLRGLVLSFGVSGKLIELEMEPEEAVNLYCLWFGRGEFAVEVQNQKLALTGIGDQVKEQLERYLPE